MILPVILGYFFDLWLGDPPWLVSRIGHPVIYMGKLIQFTEKLLKKLNLSAPLPLFLAGCFLLIFTVFFVGISTYILIFIAEKIHPFLGFFIKTFLCYQIMATKSLQTESLKVFYELKEGNLSKSRKELSFLVGRDTKNLKKEGIIKATVETVAENTTDGVVAPLFYLFFLGPVGGMCYKLVNTLDSMVGYRNETYLYLGRASARCDDFLNFIPARIAAFALLGTSFFYTLNPKQGWKIFKRDRYCHKSPNSAQTESVVAGCLGIILGGNAHYFGKLHEKPTIGDPLRPIRSDDILITTKWMIRASFLTLCFFTLFYSIYIEFQSFATL